MKNTYLTVSLVACLITQVVSATVPQIKFTGKKDWVLTSAERATVLTVADQHLNPEKTDFLAGLDDVQSPFPTKEVPAVVAAVEPTVVKTNVKQNGGSVEVESASVQVVYDDASVLRGVGDNFAKQVRGTLARGDKNYIQLQGGKLMKTGSSFPVRLPDVQDKTYIVKLIEVTSDDYTLSLGDATLTLSYSDGTTGARKTP